MKSNFSRIIISFVSIILLLTVGFVLSEQVYSSNEELDNRFINIVNPIRISKYTKNIQESFKAQYQEIKKRNISATWLLTYDVLVEPNVLMDLKKTDQNQEIGIFFEITPKYAADADVSYNLTDSWHRSNSIFLSSYVQSDRVKLIQTAFEKFKQVFGYYPKSVGAWWIDSYSLKFMKERYNIIANLSLADQFATDGYHVWGQYWSAPFLPSTIHAGIPAKKDNNLGIVTIEWAHRDPVEGYGLRDASAFSTQDYHAIGLTEQYFSGLIDLYTSTQFNKFGQVTIGLEADLEPGTYQGDYAKQLDVAIKSKANIVTMAEFASWYQINYQSTEPIVIVSESKFDTGKKAVWYQSSNYRIALISDSKSNTTDVVDFRVYHSNFEEPYYRSPIGELDLYINIPSVIDTVSNPRSVWNLSASPVTAVDKKQNIVTIKFQDQEIRLEEGRIVLNNIDNLPKHLKESAYLELESKQNDLVITPISSYFKDKNLLIEDGISIKGYFFLSRPKVSFALKTALVAIILSLFMLPFLKIKIRKKRVVLIICSVSTFAIVGFALMNHQKYEINQSEVDALLHLKMMPYGKVLVYEGGCLICTWQSDYPPPIYANNRNYISRFSNKPIVYNNKIFKTESRSQGREVIKKSAISYIYVVKFEKYKEVVPFSPGDYNIELIFENSHAQIWRVKNNND